MPEEYYYSLKRGIQMFPQGILEYYHLKQVVLWKAWNKEQGNEF
jgi:hypothetical protein